MKSDKERETKLDKLEMEGGRTIGTNKYKIYSRGRKICQIGNFQKP